MAALNDQMAPSEGHQFIMKKREITKAVTVMLVRRRDIIRL